MWKKGWRDEVWSTLDQTWDLIVVGGGITGAGVFHEAAALGLKVLLVEAHDFSFGTSSRSSKLVHGGFRYLYNRQYQVTYESVRQRETLIREAPGLIEPLPFVLPNYASYKFPGWMIHAGLTAYDLMAPKWDNQRLSKKDILMEFPDLCGDGLIGAYRYKDAVLDDTRLVLRVIKEGVLLGGTALNYAHADHLLRGSDGRVQGIALSDASSLKERQLEVKARVVVNATGPWTDRLRADLNAPPRLRKLRGSHLILAKERLPIKEAITVFHPRDRRAMFVIPWEGATLVGTTDIDHDLTLEERYAETFASQKEIAYMLEALDFLFPSLELAEEDIVSSFSGLRPIIDTGAETPSKESRAHQIWNEQGLITITGGKLTTFRLMARQTLQATLESIGLETKIPQKTPLLAPLDRAAMDGVDPDTQSYLRGRFGLEASLLLSSARSEDLEKIEALPNLWAEIRWAARTEGMVHLDDLLLRRVRIGLLLPQGGKGIMSRVREIVQDETGWDDERWHSEEAAYRQTWKTYYSEKPG
jgi:glycerol-3-phosphate dehydrogenase